MNDQIAEALAALVPAPAPMLGHRDAKASALASLAGFHPHQAGEALDALAARNRELLGDPEAIRQALADQAVLLEALMTAFSREAGCARRTDHKIALAGVALKASGQLGASLALLHRVTEDSRNAQALPA